MVVGKSKYLKITLIFRDPLINTDDYYVGSKNRISSDTDFERNKFIVIQLLFGSSLCI